MKSHASVRRNLPLASVAARFLLVAFLVFGTFNPSYYSAVTWIVSDGAHLSIKAFLGFALALCWMVVLRISLAGLGWIGLAYIGAALAILLLLEVQFGVLRLFSPYVLVILAEFAFSGAVALGLVFAYWVRQASGQSAVVKMPP
jgi:hypothetical protein